MRRSLLCWLAENQVRRYQIVVTARRKMVKHKTGAIHDEKMEQSATSYRFVVHDYRYHPPLPPDS